MIDRRVADDMMRGLGRQAAVALIGPRQVGKTTLAHQIATRADALYLDLETSEAREKLTSPALFLREYQDRLVVLDEIHRTPELFRELRGIIDEGRRQGRGIGRFLVLGSASMELLRQSGESLAGRIEYIELQPFDVMEVPSEAAATRSLWLRGGFPLSFLANTDVDSFAYRGNLVRTYLQREVAEFGPRIPAETLERLWTMLAHGQGTLLDASKLAASLSVSSPTVSRYVDLLVDLLMVRRLRPVHANVRKRLVKSPRVYVRDSGLLHALLRIDDYGALMGHPVVGASWEGFVIENLLRVAPSFTDAGFYRTSAGAEIDLVLDLPGRRGRWAIEVKHGLAPALARGFYHARDDLEVDRSFVVYSGEDRYPIAEDIEAIGLREMASLLAGM
ncbi:MAG: ATP-binding protein [Acidobacteria bacterium]|nr:ATP-binding protein [Acidobacteriota bacterium]MYJ04363.1 ATP-binding protein [Acidobacteriota bacterium]